MSKTKPFNISKWQVMQAYKLVKSNKGTAGIDKQSLLNYEENLSDNLYKLWNRLSSGSYFPPPVKAVSIRKKSGGERVLGIPTVGDRIAQTVVKLEFEPSVEPFFLEYSYGYRPNKSALDAVSITRQRCWKIDWVLEFDVKGLFDNIPHDLLTKAVHKHTENPWVRLYIKRWMTAPMQFSTGSIASREKGTPQGGVISPILANLFMHYTFDKWMQRNYQRLAWCRYADDGLIHCHSKQEAEHMLLMLRKRFAECGIELHPVKTRIVYCKDGKRKDRCDNTSFDFLGYTFRARVCRSKASKHLFVSFTPAVSKASLKEMRLRIRQLHIRSSTNLSLQEIAKRLNPIINGWINYFGRFYRSELYIMCRIVNKILVRWVRRKYKKLRNSKTRASKLIERISQETPNLFAHWHKGMVGAFV